MVLGLKYGNLDFEIFIQSIDFEFWETLINMPFINIHQIDEEVLDKSYFLWTVEENRKFEIGFKTNKFLVTSLDDSKLFYVYNFKTAKEMWDTIEMIYRVSSSFEQEEMNT